MRRSAHNSVTSDLKYHYLKILARLIGSMYKLNSKYDAALGPGSKGDGKDLGIVTNILLNVENCRKQLLRIIKIKTRLRTPSHGNLAPANSYTPLFVNKTTKSLKRVTLMAFARRPLEIQMLLRYRYARMRKTESWFPALKNCPTWNKLKSVNGKKISRFF